MLVLALDTSSAAVAAAVVEVTDESVAERSAHSRLNARGHGELLAPVIAACLADAAATPHDLDAVVAGTGPGPFTGLRVGLVTAAVVAEALGIPAYGVCSLDGIAAAAQYDGALLVLTDARRKEVYWARYGADGARTDGPHVNRPADLAHEPGVTLAGAGARLYREMFAGSPLLDLDHPPPSALARLAAGRIRAGAAGDPLTPLYLRRPDAVVPGAPKAVTP